MEEATGTIPLWLWNTDQGSDITRWSNLPVKMGDSGNWNYNSRYADNLRVIISRVKIETDQFGNDTITTEYSLDTNPDIIHGTEETPGTPSCFIVGYDIIHDLKNQKYRIEMRL